MAPKSNSKTGQNPSPSSPYDFKRGTKVEISSDDDGFRGSWYTGTIIRRSSSKNPPKYLVEYHKLFKDEAGKVPLKEVLDCGQLRPLPPKEKVRDFKFGDEVDAFYNDGWWEGNVVEERGEDGKLGVFFIGTKEKIFFGKEELRLHREWVNGKWQPALQVEDVVEEEDIEEKVLLRSGIKPTTIPSNLEAQQRLPGTGVKRAMNPSKLEPKKALPRTEVEATSAVADENFREGMLVEVSSDEEGFEGAWFTATIVKVVKRGRYLIQYQSLRTDDDTDLLKEEVDSGHIRPCPPETIMVDRFKLLEEVDALYNDGWWVGVISKVYIDSKYVVLFPGTDEELVFKHSDLRPHQEWINGKWTTASKDLKL